MRKRSFKAPSPALAVAFIALFVALGGTAYAASSLPDNSVGTPQLKNGAVTAPKVKVHSLLAKDFAAGQLPSGLAFKESSSNPTPPPGKYFVVAEVVLARGNAARTGYCAVNYVTSELQGTLFGGAFALPDNNAGGIQAPFSISGVAVVPAGTQQLFVTCTDTADQSAAPDGVDWWVAPVG